jgi:hypothetical protein
MCTEAWNDYGAVLQAQQTPRYAEDVWLAYWGQIMRRPPAPGEAQSDYRARLLQSVAVVTPAALLGIISYLVNQFIDDVIYGAVEPAVDAAYVTLADGSAPFASYCQPDTQRLLATLPDDTQINQRVAGMYAQPLTTQPLFELFLPFNAADQTITSHCVSADDGTGAGPFDYAMFGYADPGVDSLADQMYNEIEGRRGGGVSWSIYIDPYLRSAI